MELKVNDKLYGFTVTRIRDIDEIDGQLIEMTHDRTGAGLVWAKSEEENKLFSVGFRTLPEDSTGVFHILEHSVLCGSDKYPVKEPFVELIKTSMNTFLNAMTYPDKTLYPVSSKMEQDYLNLMDVYLDAVFRPRILTEPNIFYQEGWHIDTQGEEPVYKGVVFNEMKGAMSDIDQIAERTIDKLLFPDTCYGFNSGGDPEAIPDLTYDDFISRYKRFYHPSNSYFYLDGNIPLEKTLERIDSYLQDYDRLENVPELKMQVPAKSSLVMDYEAGDEDAKAVVAFARIIGSWEDRDKLFALSVLTDQLADSNESPLKRAALSSGLAEDVDLYVSDGIAQPYMMILFRGVNPGEFSEGQTYEEAVQAAADKLINIVHETVDKVLEEGLSIDDLQATVNQMDFKFRQYPEPQGLYRANAVLNSWLYGGDPALFLETNEAIDNLRKMIDEGEISKLAEEYFDNTDSFSKLVLIPNAELGAKNAAAEAERIEKTMSDMTEDEKAALEKLNENLITWQETPDSEEDLATIPQLNLADINRMPELIGTEVSEKDGVTILLHKLPTKGIAYINAYFPLTGLALEDMPSAALLTEFYKDLPTENYSVLELQTEIKKYLGSISFGIDINARDDDNKVCTPCLRARAAVLFENISHAEDLMIEILTKTKFDDKALMKELITQIDDEGKRYAVSTGHRVAMYAARSHYSSRDAAAEALNGYTFITFMHDMNANFDDKIDDFVDFAHTLIEENVVKAGAVMSITASEDQDISRLISMLPEGTERPAYVSYTSALPKRLGISIPSQVSYSVAAYDLAEMGVRPEGSISVASNILSYAHLWNEIRVKGGAYGTGVSASRTGSMLSYSYRDPSPDRSLEVYKTIPDFLTAFTSMEGLENGGLDGFIISTIASTEPLTSVSSKGRSADDFWFSGFSDDDRIKVRSEIIDATPEDVAKWSDAFAKMANEGCVCVVGPKSALDACKDIEIVNI